jgi:TM2 domain-containing membrane protein YozV
MYPQQNYGGGPMQDWQRQGADKKVAAGLCGILLGGFGVHKFILGYQQEGVAMLTLFLVGLVLFPFTCGASALLILAINIIALVEGIIYLTKSDEEFVRTYIQGRKGWF